MTTPSVAQEHIVCANEPIYHEQEALLSRYQKVKMKIVPIPGIA